MRISYDKEKDEMSFERKKVHLATDKSIKWPKEEDPSRFDVCYLLNSDNMGYGIFTPDDRSVYFLERYLSKLLRHPEFSATESLVAIETLQNMIENGHYPISKL